METQVVRVAAIQSNCTADIEANRSGAEAQIRQAAAEGAQLVCLQELFTSLYFCQSEDHAQFELAESIPGPTTAWAERLAAELNIVLVASLFERRAAGLFHNTAAVFDRDGSMCGIYRKMHIPDDPNYYEKFFFTPGDLGFRAFDTAVGKVGVCICWDQWYPEAARLTALQGADFLVYPTAIGWLPEDKPVYGPSQLAAWQTMIRSHAIANGIHVIAPNRLGIEGNIEFWGRSFIADPYGNIVGEASETRPEVLIADCDVATTEVARTHWPFLRDRRIDAYQGLTRRWIDGP